MKKNFLNFLSVLCLFVLVAAAGRAEARVHVNFTVGGPVVYPCPPPVCRPCPPPPCHARHHFHRHHHRHHHCPQRLAPPRPASHAHRVHQHRHPVHRHGGRGRCPHKR